MHFRVTPGSETFLKLLALAERGNAYKQLADELAISLGAEDYCAGPAAYGGIQALCFAQPPAGYDFVQQPDFYYPTAGPANAALLARIAALPQLSNAEFSAPLGYEAQVFQHEGRLLASRRPGVEFGEGFMLVDVPAGVSFTPGSDLTPITEAEFLAALPAAQKPD